jgi:hypothetical protein
MSTPLKNMKVSWDDEIPSIWKIKNSSQPPNSYNNNGYSNGYDNGNYSNGYKNGYSNGKQTLSY